MTCLYAIALAVGAPALLIVAASLLGSRRANAEWRLALGRWRWEVARRMTHPQNEIPPGPPA